MRCQCCNRNLNDFESTLKSVNNKTYIDTCIKCLDGLGIETIGRPDLSPEEEIGDGDWSDTEIGEYDET